MITDNPVAGTPYSYNHYKKDDSLRNEDLTIKQLLSLLGYNFRDLSYHTDGRWIARSGAGTGRFMTSAKTPEEALLKLLKKFPIEQLKESKD